MNLSTNKLPPDPIKWPSRTPTSAGTVAQNVSRDPIDSSQLGQSGAGQLSDLPTQNWKGNQVFSREPLHATSLGFHVGGVSGMAAGAASLAWAGSGIGGMLGGMIGGAIVAGGALAASAALLGAGLKDLGKYAPKPELPSRNADGRFRAKSGSTHIETLRDTYGEGFAAGLPGNMPLQLLRSATGLSLTKMVKNPDTLLEARQDLKDWKAPETAPNGRIRNADGTFRQKRGDTKIDTLRKTYGMDFAAQLPGNFPLALLREISGKSLSQLVAHPEYQQLPS